MAELNTSQQFPVVLEIFKADGVTPAQVDGTPVWATSDATVIDVVPSADGMTALAPAVAPGGPARFTVTADADLGAGVVTITGVSEDITVVIDPANAASIMKITLSAPIPK